MDVLSSEDLAIGAPKSRPGSQSLYLRQPDDRVVECHDNGDICQARASGRELDGGGAERSRAEVP